MGKFLDNYDWDLSDFLIEDNEDVILKIEIDPIERNKYYFYVFRNDDNYYVKVYYKTDEEWYKDIINISKSKKMNKKTPMSDVYETIVGSKEYNEYCQKNNDIYYMKLDNDYLKKIVDLILNLDYSKDQGRAFGFDGYSLFMSIENTKNSFDSWVYCKNEYYYPILEFANYLLDCLSLYSDNRFYLPEDYKQSKKKIIDNEILLDRERLNEQFQNKIKLFTKTQREELLNKIENVSSRKLLKINFNCRRGMFEYEEVKQIIDYIINQKEDSNFKCFGWVEYEKRDYEEDDSYEIPNDINID